MKTSNKLLIGTGICIILGIFSFAFMMRGAYQKAIANPIANEVRIDLKAMKYLNIKYDYYVTFKHGNKYEIVMDKDDKDSLKIDYQGDIANLVIGNTGNVTIYTPQLPVISFTKKNILNNNGISNIVVDSSFQSGEFLVTTSKKINFEFRKCRFDKIDVKSNDPTEIILDECEVKLLNITMPPKSSLNINYSNILAKNIVAGDSCSVVVTGNQSIFLK
jgi:hypothetical protein